MTINILFSAGGDKWATYEAPLRAALTSKGLNHTLAPDAGPPERVDYIVYAPDSTLQDFAPYRNCKAVLNLWAGVEEIVGNPTLTQPLTRMVDTGLTHGMVEWVTGHVLRHHLGLDRYVGATGGWHDLRVVPPLAKDRPLTILGLGALGAAVAEALVGLGFPITGWSRSPKTLNNVRCLAGDDGLREALSTAEILVLLLPETPDTTNLLNAERLSWLRPGAVVINPGRGPLIDDEALLAALDEGQVGHATLDVFRVEPLPDDHAFWSHPRVTVTPHIASETRPGTACDIIVENILRSENGQPLLHLVDRSAGY
ncbi:MAG: glyoxylate/hydroxypyruvate reductase A [Pseudomonadota bacterium]